MNHSITPQQCRSARAWLDWTLDNLVKESGVSIATIVKFEKGTRVPQDRTLRDLETAFAKAGIEFQFDGARGIGIRLRKELDNA
jgi:transcriptional regulator with XRE-family HTH domain